MSSNTAQSGRKQRVLVNVNKRLPEPKSEVGRALTIEQLHHLEAIAATRDEWLVAYHASVLAASTGVRGGEIRKLRLGAIDLEKRRVRVIRKTTKTDAGARLVELNQAGLKLSANYTSAPRRLVRLTPNTFCCQPT